MLKYRLLRNCTFGEYFMSPGSMEQAIGYTPKVYQEVHK